MSDRMLVHGNALKIPIADQSVHCVVTSPPYFQLRDYSCVGQLGLEQTPGEYVAQMVRVFREVWRVLRDDGTLWLVIGDSFSSGGMGGHNSSDTFHGHAERNGDRLPKKAPPGLKPKDIVGIPWTLALALRDDGWYLRDPIAWAKAEVDDNDQLEGSAMPGSQEDRCTSAHEMIFMLAKSERYFYDSMGCKTASGATLRNVWRINPEPSPIPHYAIFPREIPRRAISLGTSDKGCCSAVIPKLRLKTNLSPEKLEQVACYPKDIPDEFRDCFDVVETACGAPWVRLMRNTPMVIRRPGRREAMGHDSGTCPSGTMISPPKHEMLGWHRTCDHDAEPVPCTVFDCFSGVSTTGVVAEELKRRYIGLDLSHDYLRLAQKRLDRPHAKVKRPKRKEHYPMFDRPGDNQ